MSFESGTPLGGTKFSNSIVHAHVHSAPLKVSPENDKLMKEQMFLEPFDYRNRLSELENKSYSLLIDANDQGFASTSLNRPRQIFRKVIAKQIGKEEAWNWREAENEFIKNITRTVDLLQPKLKQINQSNFYLNNTLAKSK